jgi:hypothetical protein
MTAMRFQTKFLFPLALVFLIASAPLCQSVVSIKEGDKVEVHYKIVKNNYKGSTGTEEGNISITITAFREESGVMKYDATHKKNTKTTSVTNNVITPSFSSTKQSDTETMTNQQKTDLSYDIWNVCDTIIESGEGLIVSQEISLNLNFNYIEEENVTLTAEGQWNENGRLLYYVVEARNPANTSSIKYEFENLSSLIGSVNPDTNSDEETIPGFPIIPFAGLSILAIFMVMRKSKKVQYLQ